LWKAGNGMGGVSSTLLREVGEAGDPGGEDAGFVVGEGVIAEGMAECGKVAAQDPADADAVCVADAVAAVGGLDAPRAG
jgi:hypothetical protein